MTEFKKKYEALSARTQALLDANPDLIFRIDREGRYLDFHAGDPASLAIPPEEFLGHTVAEAFGPEFASAAQSLISKALATREMQTWEYPLEIDGEMQDFEARIVPSGDNEVIAIVRDITTNKAIYRELQTTESRLNEAQTIARIGSWERDLITNKVWWSDEVYRLLDISPADTQASLEVFLEKVHPGDRPNIVESLEAAVRSGCPYSAYHRVILSDGTVRSFHDRAIVVTDGQGRPIRLTGTLQDVTDRIELERAIISIGEQERERIGRDLHDSLGQILVAISLKLKMLLSGNKADQSIDPEEVLHVEENVHRAIVETRRVSRLLSPRIAGLAPALETLTSQAGIGADVQRKIVYATGHERHAEDVEMHLYRIAQEALNNAVRHSGARNIELIYECSGKSISLRVSDDGSGIPDHLNELDGIGLRNMRYRARMINGRFETRRRAEGGTTVICECPCRLPIE